MMPLRELTAYCWEKLRARDFRPYGKEFWGGWFLSASYEQLIRLAALLDTLEMTEAEVATLVSHER